MFYIYKNPGPRSVATVQNFDLDPGFPWEKYDAAAEAWVEDAKAVFVPPVLEEHVGEVVTDLFIKSIGATIAALQDDLRSQDEQIVSLRESVVELLKRF